MASSDPRAPPPPARGSIFFDSREVSKPESCSRLTEVSGGLQCPRGADRPGAEGQQGAGLGALCWGGLLVS